MMRKFLCALLTLGMAFGMTFAAAACGNKGGDNGKGSETSGSDVTQSSEGVSSESAESEEIDEGGDGGEEFIPDFSSTTDVIEYFSGRTGEVTYNTGKDLVIESLDEDAPIILGHTAKTTSLPLTVARILAECLPCRAAVAVLSRQTAVF